MMLFGSDGGCHVTKMYFAKAKTCTFEGGPGSESKKGEEFCSQMTVEKPKPTLSLRPITTGEACVINQSEFLAITCYKAQEKSFVKGALGFGFASHWLKHWRETFKPIT